ncbi:hypothetical protein BGZ70_008182 [Mortierella alpina]|uniref:Uncharacterized protein n=1 Tax=Mortierella alpina TaxID=64518 RepID=A0A9P6M6P9_MORAP|nr:hypothetical protein BGZ70_008182 [Mortierella alpina]
MSTRAPVAGNTSSATAMKRKKDFFFEQKLFDDIIHVLGPHLVDLSLKQDCLWTPPASSVTGQQQQQGNPRLLDINTCLYGVTHMPQSQPRVILSHSNQVFNSLHLPWLRQLKIVYRATADAPLFLGRSGPSPDAALAHFLPESSVQPHPGPMLDLSACLALEVLSIEDHAHTGQPHQLRRYKRQEGEVDVVPFDRDQGIKFPSRLKALDLIGLTADKFNLGWLKHTPQINYVNVIGVRHSLPQNSFDGLASDSLDDKNPHDSDCSMSLPPSMWQLTDVQNLSLRHLQIHHHPTRHFRFKMLRNIPGLESLDLRDVPVDVIREAAEESEVGEGPTLEMSPKRFVVIFRLQIVGVVESTVEWTSLHLKTVLERYLPNVVKLHVDGLPVSQLIELTTGPSIRARQASLPEEGPQAQDEGHEQEQDHDRDHMQGQGQEQKPMEEQEQMQEQEPAQKRGSDGTVYLHQLAQVLTNEKLSTRDILIYSLVRMRCTPPLEPSQELQNLAIVSLRLRIHSITYITQGRIWQRVESSMI